MLDAIMGALGMGGAGGAQQAMQTAAQAQAGLGANGLTQSGATSNPLPSNPAEVDYAMQMQQYSADEMLPEQNPADAFDYKKMLQGLGKAGGQVAQAQQQDSMKPVQLSRPQAGGAAPVMMPTGLGQGQSGAMQAIQGGGMGSMIGGQPSREQLLRMMGGM